MINNIPETMSPLIKIIPNAMACHEGHTACLF